MPTLDETFRNTAPSQPLNKASYRHSNDPIKRIGYQYQVSGMECYSCGFLLRWSAIILSKKYEAKCRRCCSESKVIPQPEREWRHYYAYNN